MDAVSIVYTNRHLQAKYQAVTVTLRMVRKGVRAQTHNARETRFIMYTINTRHETTKKGK